MNDGKPTSLKVASEWCFTLFLCVIIISLTSCEISSKFASADCVKAGGIYKDSRCDKDK